MKKKEKILKILNYLKNLHNENKTYNYKNKISENKIIENLNNFMFGSVETLVMATIYVEKVGGININTTLWSLCLLCNKLYDDDFEIVNYLVTSHEIDEYHKFEKTFLTEIGWKTHINRDTYVDIKKKIYN